MTDSIKEFEKWNIATWENSPTFLDCWQSAWEASKAQDAAEIEALRKWVGELENALEYAYRNGITKESRKIINEALAKSRQDV